MFGNLLPKKRKQYFFDAASFTPISAASSAAVIDVLKKQTQDTQIANPSSIHQSGREANNLLEDAKKKVAAVLQVTKRDIFFTSGATEANMRIVATALQNATHTKKPHIIISADEHASLKRAMHTANDAVRVSVIDPDERGYITPEHVQKELTPDTVLVSVHYVNNVTGLVQPIKDIAQAVHAQVPKALVHSDCSQAGAYYNCALPALGIDAVTLDGTKMFGPQGVGVLALTKSASFVGEGGKHTSWDIRPGTPSIALVAGIAAAYTTIAKQDTYIASLRELQQTYIQELAAIPQVYIHGIGKEAGEVRAEDIEKIAPHILTVSFPHTQHEYLQVLLDTDGFMTSTGSACTRTMDAVEVLRVSFLSTTTKGRCAHW